MTLNMPTCTTHNMALLSLGRILGAMPTTPMHLCILGGML